MEHLFIGNLTLKTPIAMDNLTLIIAKEYTKTPGPRNEREGSFSGEVFRKDILSPKLNSAIGMNKALLVDLDGTAGYGTSFLEEAFGGLIRNEGLTLQQVKKYLVLKSEEEPYLIEDINNYLVDASNEQNS